MRFGGADAVFRLLFARRPNVSFHGESRKAMERYWQEQAHAGRAAVAEMEVGTYASHGGPLASKSTAKGFGELCLTSLDSIQVLLQKQPLPSSRGSLFERTANRKKMNELDVRRTG